MSIDARIASVMVMKDHVWLRLRPIQASDGEILNVGGGERRVDESQEAVLALGPQREDPLPERRGGPTPKANNQKSIPGRNTLIIAPPYAKLPKAGQQIWGNAGACIVEAGFGGERIEYAREGNLLREKKAEAE